MINTYTLHIWFDDTNDTDWTSENKLCFTGISRVAVKRYIDFFKQMDDYNHAYVTADAGNERATYIG